MNSFGLDELNTSRLMSILESHSCISKAVIFGSRARNTFKVTSDIDIAIWTDLNSESLSLSSNVISSLKADFEDSLIPYTVDLIDYQQLSNQRLKEEIDRYGKVFYLRGWVETSLGEVCEKIGSGSTPRGGNEVYKNKGISLIRSQNVLDFDFSYNGLAFIDDIQASLLNNVTVLSGDILINITGDSVARVCMVPERVLPARVNQHVSILRTIKESLLPEFLKYYLLNPVFKNYLLILANSGGTRNALTKGILENLKIFLPPLSEQKAIAAVLSSLDDKIELLREQNKTLETIAQVLFKEWFIDFNFPDENDEPYKKSGGKMVDSELGEIPEGWRVKSVSEIIAITDGTHDSPKQVEQGYPLITSKHINKDSIDIKKAYLISKTDFDDINRRSKVEQFDILISMIGTVGLIMPILSDQIDFAIKNVGLFRTSAKLEFFEYILLTLKSSSGSNYIQQNQSGTTQKYLTLGGLRDFTIFEPSYCLLQRFHSCTNSLYLKLKLNLEEIEELSNTRDKLLPKLMKGEIRLRK
jgi:type I restriction enzyme S subunit